MNWNGTYDSNQPLRIAEYPGLHRNVGIMVSDPMMHHGFTPPKSIVQIEIERPSFNTASTVDLAVDSQQWKPAALKHTQSIIGHLDRAIHELQEHRKRLMNELPLLREPQSAR